MGQRNCTVSVSDTEKNALDEVAEEEFGTTDVAYGAVVSALTNDYLNNDN